MKKSVAGQKIGAQMIDATTGAAFTSSVTVYVTGDAGTQAAGSVGSGACTHEGNGYHTYAPAQAETNYDLVAFTFIGTGAIPQTVQVFTSFPQTGDAYGALASGVTVTTNNDKTGYRLSATGDAYGALASGVTVTTNNDKTGYRLSATGVDDVWDEATAGHATAGTTGKAITDAGSAGTPPTVNQIADGVMQRASSNWEAAAPAKSLGAAVMKLTHKVDSAAGTMTTYRSDGTTPHMTQAETTDAAADPLTGLGGAA